MHVQVTPLHLAAEKGHHLALVVLLGAGANPESLDQRNRSPLLSAAAADWEYTVLELLSRTSNVHTRDSATGR